MKKQISAVLFVLSVFVSLPVYSQEAQVRGSDNIADMEVRIQELEEQIKSLNGKLEEANYKDRRLEDQVKKLEEDVNFRLNKLEQAPAPATVPAIQEGRSGQQNNAANNNIPKSFKSNNGPFSKSEIQDSALKALGTPQEQYNNAYSLLKNGKYDDAIAAFQNFIDSNPKDKLQENAYYWLGESHYSKKDYKQSSVIFLECYKQFPKGGKAPDCLLKLAMSLGNIGQIKQGCVTLSKLKSEFPKTSGGVKARIEKQSKEWKCE